MPTSQTSGSTSGYSKDAMPFSRPHTPKLSPSQVGFIGLGHIGFFMAKNLALAAPDNDIPVTGLLVWNRTVEKSLKLVDSVGSNKVRIADGPEQIAKECDFIFVNLANDEVVRSIYQQLIATMKKSPPVRTKIFVETSTVYPTLAAELEVSISSFPYARFITCPVVGTPPVAEKSQLLLVMSGDHRTKKEVAFLLYPAVGRKILDLGENVQKASTFKLIANSLILGNLEILAETFTFAEKAGIGSDHVNELIEEYFPVPSVVNYANKMLAQDFDGSNGFNINGGIKDSTHIRRCAAKYNSPMPAIDSAHRNLLTARANHTRLQKEGTSKWDVLDWSSIIGGTRVAAGLNAFDRQQDTNVVTVVNEQN